MLQPVSSVPQTQVEPRVLHEPLAKERQKRDGGDDVLGVVDTERTKQAFLFHVLGCGSVALCSGERSSIRDASNGPWDPILGMSGTGDLEGKHGRKSTTKTVPGDVQTESFFHQWFDIVNDFVVSLLAIHLFVVE